MPNITAAGTYTKDSAGFAFLAWPSQRTASEEEKVLLFAGSTIGSSCVVQYIDDQGTGQTFANGTISELPASVSIKPIRRDIQIVTTGTPSFNVTSGD
jgi:hypothetical protein